MDEDEEEVVDVEASSRTTDRIEGVIITSHSSNAREGQVMTCQTPRGFLCRRSLRTRGNNWRIMDKTTQVMSMERRSRMKDKGKRCVLNKCIILRRTDLDECSSSRRFWRIHGRHWCIEKSSEDHRRRSFIYRLTSGESDKVGSTHARVQFLTDVDGLDTGESKQHGERSTTVDESRVQVVVCEVRYGLWTRHDVTEVAGIRVDGAKTFIANLTDNYCSGKLVINYCTYHKVGNEQQTLSDK